MIDITILSEGYTHIKDFKDFGFLHGELDKSPMACSILKKFMLNILLQIMLLNLHFDIVMPYNNNVRVKG